MDGAIALIVVLLVVQMWLLSATLEAYLGGYRETALPGAIASGLLCLASGALYRFVVRIEQRR
jgi:hypothetical protein